MAIVKYTPMSLISHLQDEINRAWGHSHSLISGDDESSVEMSQWMPAVDIKEEADKFMVLADIPGVEAKDVDVSVEKGALIIRGERHTEFSEEKEGVKRKERHDGVFYRRFMLPDTADMQGITAKSRNGVYEITIPKSGNSSTRRITVESE